MTAINVAIVLSVLLSALILLLPRVQNARLWRATITPLASIIGSGFLVLGPLLDASYGIYAPLVMAGLCLCAWGFGAAIRFNIAQIQTGKGAADTTLNRLETSASWALALAYVISVAYYLNLFGSFAVSLTPVNDAAHAKLLTTAVFVLILFFGWTRGFVALERMEQFSVGLKLSIIAGLLVGLGFFFVDHVARGELVANPPVKTGWAAVTLAFGLIVTVQGFETSRYMGEVYDAGTRIRSMRLAQGISGVIYMTYILLLSFVFAPGELNLSENAIIDMMAIVAPILPALLVAAALSAQFSAAVADTGGAGGLIVELTQGQLTARQAYAALTAAGLLLTWSANLFEIISYASRAFAIYYAIQATISSVYAQRSSAAVSRQIFYWLLAALGVSIAFFGQSVDAG